MKTNYELLFMVKSVSQGLGSTPPETLTSNGSVLPASGNYNHVFVSKIDYDYRVTPTVQPSLCFRRFTSNLLCSCSASVAPPLVSQIPTWKPLLLSYKILFLPHVHCWYLEPHLRRRQSITGTKLAFVNLAVFWVSGLCSPSVGLIAALISLLLSARVLLCQWQFN